MDGTRIHKLQKIYLIERRVDVWCMYVGDTDVRSEALSGREKQRRDWPYRERRATGHATQLPPDPVQPNDQVLGLRPEQTSSLHRTQSTAEDLVVMLFAHRNAFLPHCVCSTILAEEKVQQEERSRMEIRRQMNVSWDSGGSDEAPPKPSRPGYPSPRSSEAFFTSPQHMGQHNHFQMGGYPGPHGTPPMYPSQGAGMGLDPHNGWNQHRAASEHGVWSPGMEDGAMLRPGIGQPLPPHMMEEQLMLQQQQMEEDQRWLEQEERLMKTDSRNSRGSIEREDCSLQGPTGNQHIYQPVGKADHAVPPKKPPRPGASGHAGSAAGPTTADGYNDGVKIQPQEISSPPTANLDRSNDKVYENVTALVKAVIEMSSKIQPAPPEEYVPMVKDVGLALRNLLATVDETIPLLPAHTHREVEMAQKLLNSDLAELINKMKLAQQYVMTSLQQDYKKQMLTAAHALAVDAKNLLDVIDQARLKMLGQARPH
ncbi:focal adhesion kinase 1 isoform X7 [Trichomycterus rosablanca]|uniref:focal adhesion kinase 1 isoform X7 n=1 Tax=Trichomycterus rosablanca TaxID=2290929 RepID=UPI002F359919